MMRNSSSKRGGECVAVQRPVGRLPLLPLRHESGLDEHARVVAEQREADANASRDLRSRDLLRLRTQEFDDADARGIADRLENEGSILNGGGRFGV